MWTTDELTAGVRIDTALVRHHAPYLEDVFDLVLCEFVAQHLGHGFVAALGMHQLGKAADLGLMEGLDAVLVDVGQLQQGRVLRPTTLWWLEFDQTVLSAKVFFE